MIETKIFFILPFPISYHFPSVRLLVLKLNAYVDIPQVSSCPHDSIEYVDTPFASYVIGFFPYSSKVASNNYTSS